ncbi:DUF2101 family protein [Thermococcus gorgonarius]|uniref:DUF2101 domain-containing protein n=1 Tax=Thermococcus gorgonarius TaxID=71997 RepID=A0A2Z2M7D2_THEGO|nr:DUF2101 family protein [Thermococcus gorgonarius]ASJ01189.1 hypothetical protein A3K92_06680 [Thermococcus gorgonarius]
MALDEVLYSLGEATEALVSRIGNTIKDIAFPEKTERPPEFKFLKKLVKKDFTPHEFISLKLQLVFLTYLVLSLLTAVSLKSHAYLSLLFIVELLYIRYIIRKTWDFIINPGAYRFFYYGISTLAFLSFEGYLVLRELKPEVYYYYAYLMVILAIVLIFRWYFKRKFGRDYTYGVVEEVKNDLVRVFIHDDIAANVKPGYYWLPEVEDAKPGRVVKILIEDRAFRSAKPLRILEVYLEDTGQSSQTETEPKEEIE